MPAYKPSRKPDAYPVTFAEAFNAIRWAKPGTRYETAIGAMACGAHKAMQQRVSSFKATIRNYPLHPLHDVIPRTRTKLRFVPMGDGKDMAMLMVEKVVLHEGLTQALKGEGK